MPETMKGFTLFLDRDGVINKELPADYVKSWYEFEFEHGVLTALSKAAEYFGRIIVVTNQRGVGSGLMTEDDLKIIHSRMKAVIEEYGGRIDAIYSANDADRSSTNRKPYPTMGLKAKQDFPDIDFQKAVIVGNSDSDMEFGKALPITTVFIDEKNKYINNKPENADYIYKSFADFIDDLIV